MRGHAMAAFGQRHEPTNAQSSGTGEPHPVVVSATLPNGEVIVIPIAQSSRAHDAKELGRTSQRPVPQKGPEKDSR